MALGLRDPIDETERSGALAATVACTYAVAGILWILCSDWLVRSAPSWIAEVKGLCYVIFTAVMLLLVLRRRDRAIASRERALIGASDRLAALSEGSADFSAIVDPDGTVQFLSEPVEAVLGRSASTVGRIFDPSLLHPDDRPLLDAAYRAAIGGEPQHCTIRVQHASGEWRTLHCDLIDHLDKASVGGLVVHVRDVSETQERDRVVSSLLEGSTLLAAATSELAVAEVVLEACLDAIGATGGAVRRLDEEHQSLVTVASRGVDLGGALYELPLDGGSLAAQAARERRAVALEGPPGTEAVLATTPLGAVALLYVPMLLSGRTIGTIGLGFTEPRRFSRAVADSLLTFAHQAALALERTQLEAEQRAAQAATAEAARRTEALQRITEVFSRSLTVSDVLDAALDAVVGVLGANGAMAALRTRGHRLRIVAWRGALQPAPDAPTTIDLDAPRPLCAVSRDGRTRWYGSRHELDAEFGHDHQTDRYGASGGIVGLTIDGLPVGALAVIYASPGGHDQADRDLVASIGALCSEALRRAGLYEDEHRSAQRRLALQRATADFASAADRTELRAAAVRAVGDALGSLGHAAAGFLDEGDERTDLELLMTADVDGEVVLRSERIDAAARRPVAAVLRDGRARYYEDRAAIEAEFGTDNDLPDGQVSGAVVPVCLEARVVGVLAVSCRQPNRLFDLDHELLESIALVCAEALRRIRLAEIERRSTAYALALHRMTEAFSRSVTVDEVIHAAVEALIDTLQPATAGATLAGSAGAYREWSCDVARNRRIRRRPVGEDDLPPVNAAVLADGRARFLESEEEVTADVAAAAHHRFVFNAGALVPLSIDGRSIGLIGVTFGQARRFPAADRELMTSLAALCAEAVRRAGHFEQTRTAALRYQQLSDNYEHLFVGSPMPMAVYDTTDNRILASNQALHSAFGYPPEELATMTTVDLLNPTQSDVFAKSVGRTFAPHDHIGVVLMQRKDGTTFYMDVSSHDAETFAGRPARLCLFVDHTARIHAERANRDLQQRVVAVAEEERRRLASDLHDGPIQNLSVVLMRFGGLRRELQPMGAASVERADRMERDLRATIESLRSLMHDLYPPSFETMTLAQALHAAALEQPWPNPLVVRIDDTSHRQLPATLKAALYRVAMEALHNVQKHAAATAVDIELCDDVDVITLRVIDDGVGIATTGPQPAGHLGLAAMQDRISLLGGTCRIERASRQGGTVVEASVPLEMDGTLETDVRRQPSVAV